MLMLKAIATIQATGKRQAGAGRQEQAGMHAGACRHAKSRQAGEGRQEQAGMHADMSRLTGKRRGNLRGGFFWDFGGIFVAA